MLFFLVSFCVVIVVFMTSDLQQVSAIKCEAITVKYNSQERLSFGERPDDFSFCK